MHRHNASRKIVIKLARITALTGWVCIVAPTTDSFLLRGFTRVVLVKKPRVHEEGFSLGPWYI